MTDDQDPELDAHVARCHSLVDKMGAVLDGATCGEIIESLSIMLANICADCHEPHKAFVDCCVILHSTFGEALDSEPDDDNEAPQDPHGVS